MKNTKKSLIIILVLTVLLSLTGCNKVFNKGKTIELTKGTSKVAITYPDNDNIKLMSVGNTKILKNEKENYKIIFAYENRNIKEQKAVRARFKEGTGPTFKDNINYNGYKGYAQISNVSGSTQVYLYLDEKKDIVFSAKISSVDLNKTIDELLDKKTGQVKKGKKAEDALFNKKEVQTILKSIKYEQTKEQAKGKTTTNKKGNSA